MDSAQQITVIVTESTRGRGIENDPYRNVTQYWSPEGKKLAERDPVYELAVTDLRAMADHLKQVIDADVINAPVSVGPAKQVRQRLHDLCAAMETATKKILNS